MTPFYTVAVKIQFRPAICSGEELAFSLMLTDIFKAALADNIFRRGEYSLNVAPLPSGYMVFSSVVNLQDGLVTIQKLLERYRLFHVSEIVWRGPLELTFHHHSGLELGPFERHIDEAFTWQKQLKEIHSKLNP